MILWLIAAAHAGPWAGLRNTADTLERGQAVVRLPTGRSALGVGPASEVWMTPFDVTVGGTRVGVEQGLVGWGPVSWSLAPSVAEKWSLGRTALRVESFVSVTGEADRLSLVVAPDWNFMRRTTLGAERSRQWSLDRTHVPVALHYDHTWTDTVVRGSVKVGVYDEGETVTHGVFTASWIHRWGGLHVELGAGILVGRPSEHTFLGTYERVLVAGFPRVDLWWQWG